MASEDDSAKQTSDGATNTPSVLPHREETLERKSDRWMVCLTALAAFAAVVSALIFDRQLNVMSQQLSVMEAQTRPWISATGNNSTDIRTTNGDVRGHIEIRITNVGNAPAGDVWVEAKARPMRPEIMSVVKPGQVVKPYCDQVAHNWQPIHASGITLFPGEFDQSSVELSIPKKDVLAAIDNAKKYMIVVVGCASYTFYSSPIRHRTGFSFVIGNSDKDAPLSYLIPEMALNQGVAKNDVRIMKITTGSYAD